MLNKITRLVLVFVLVELFLGGGGRLTAWGPVSMRMILFSVAIVLTIIHVLRGARIDIKYLKLIGIFTLMLLVGIVTGLIVGADKKLLWEDVKPLLFFYLLPFFAIAINKEDDQKKIGRIILFSAGIMASLFLVVIILFLTGTIEFLDFYNLTNATGEFFFRGEYSFFYKGFIYLCIGFLFAHLTGEKKLWWLMIILFGAIIFSFTRGLLFALGLSYVIYYLFIKRFYAPTIIAIIICSLIVFYGKDFYALASTQIYNVTVTKKLPEHSRFKEKLLGDREFSDNERKHQIMQVASATTLPSTVWGHGFGTGVESRPQHMEISYLEIFHKQGIIGIACWSIILFSLVKSYNKLPHESKLSNAYFLGALFVFFQSLTNQYINNPIGLGMILISIVSLDVALKKNS